MELKYRLQTFLGKLISRPISNLLINNLELQLQKLATESTATYIYKNMGEAIVLKSKFEVLDYALENVNLSDGIFLEFGVYKGTTINYLAKKLPLSKIYGFDSFEGLPEYWRDGFKKGAFKLHKKPKTRKNIEIYEGLFEKSIPNFLLDHSDFKISFIHVDCDLYSSTKDIFGLLGKFINKGTIIVFDEYFNFPNWENDEFKAFGEFINKTGHNYNYLAYNKFHEQVAVKIT